MVQARAVAEHFSQVLRRGRLDAVRFAGAERFAAVPRETIATGRLPAEVADSLFAQHDRNQGRGPRGKAEPDAAISVVISLLSVTGASGAFHDGLLLMGATLQRDGRLEPVLEAGSSPWIPAERLSSEALTDREVMVGALRDFWAHVRTRLAAQLSQVETGSGPDGAAGAVEVAQMLLRAVAGTDAAGFAARYGDAGVTIEHETCYVQELDRIDAAKGLLEVYEHLRHAEELPPLVVRTIQGWPGPRMPEEAIHLGEGRHAAARLACGSMSAGRPLTPSQRRAVHGFLIGGEGAVTAVSGPPGTGKTTMLQSVVANLLVRHALEGREAPVIVGTSTNNQAVQNIIESFGSVAPDEPGLLDLRWLPREEDGVAVSAEPMRSLAVNCPSRAKLEEARKRYLVEQKDKSLTYAAYSAEEYLAGARDVFVARAAAFLGRMADPPRLQEWLHEALAEVDALRLRLLDAMHVHGPGSEQFGRACAAAESCEHLRELPGLARLQGCADLEQLDGVLDSTLRHAEFWLAVHCYEARWLGTEDFLGPDDRWKSTPAVMERYWRQAAALTPCFVMTVYQVPRYLERWVKDGERPEFDIGRIDLLIVDEAGQVDTPLALPVLALARSALVVGDEQQLAPVWSIDEETDREMASGVGIGAAPWETELRARGLTCSVPSSLMRAASHASRWSFGDGAPGLLLREHFRCHPDIIGFCNDLLYDGLLEPMRDPAATRIDGPAFRFVDVPSSQDSRQGTSRINRPEAAAVAAWIVGHYAELLDLYRGQEEDPGATVAADALIGVVTPFAAQARVITEEIRSAARAAGPEAGLPGDLAGRITVGTAHRLQGAERPVVLFSAVYGTGSDAAPFIDATPQLMNVAVSRAKDLLVVFAAPNRWARGPVFEVMSAHATRSSRTPDAGLPDAGPPDAEPPGRAADAGSAEPSGRAAPQSSAEDRPLPATAEPVTLSRLLRAWREDATLREEDAGLTAAALNLRLREAGVLTGGPGGWAPSPLAAHLGVQEVERTGADGTAFSSIEYTAAMQEILRAMYRDGRI
ncbi:DEAD/DEAH box helicase [Brachybacterium hainanense]|uniref:DEAD/DEAH box helicase n=1 Tax=Brachybacterium hainanense TaxID=1541174 RepID=A0ABV6RAL6_9MICO